MGFRQADGEKRGGYAKIWSYYDVTNGATIELSDGKKMELSPGNYSIVRLTTWKKKKGLNSTEGLPWNEVYEVDFQDGFVKLIGSANAKAKELGFDTMSFDKGYTIQITSCEVTTTYNAQKKKSYTNYAIFAFDVPQSQENNTKKPTKKTQKTKSEKTKSKSPIVLDDDLMDDEDLPF